jgi:hypothetical protein
MKKIILTIFSVVLVSGVLTISLESCKKKKKDDTNPSSSSSSSTTTDKGNIMVFAKPAYCANYTGVLTVKIDGESKGTIENCDSTRSCGDAHTVTVEVTTGSHKVEVASSSYSYSGDITVSKGECKQVPIQ